VAANLLVRRDGIRQDARDLPDRHATPQHALRQMLVTGRRRHIRSRVFVSPFVSTGSNANEIWILARLFFVFFRPGTLK